MATAESFIKRALTKLGVRAAESPIQPEEIQDGLDLLNDMLSEWENSGVTMGFLPVENASDEVRVPRNAHSAIKANLAVRSASEYGRVVQQALALEASQSFDNLMISLSDIGDVNYPSTLPTGSGNECDSFGNLRRFFPEDQDENF